MPVIDHPVCKLAPGKYDGKSPLGYRDILGLLGEIESVNQAGVTADPVGRIEELNGIWVFGADELKQDRVLGHVLDARHVLKLAAQAGHLGEAAPHP